MKGAIITGAKKIEVQDFPMPQSDGYHVITKVETVGICGSDLHFWDLGDLPAHKFTRVGHEHSLIVVDPGARTDLKPGDRVTSIPLPAPCGKCGPCLEHKFDRCENRETGVGNFPNGPAGSMAEYFATAPSLVRKIPDTMSNEEAAMVEPCATLYSAVKRQRILTGEKVIVFGGGIIGSFAAQWAKYFGAGYVAMVEVNKFRGEKNLKDGNIDELFDGADPELVPKLLKATGGAGFDYAFECTGQSVPINTAVLACKIGATITMIGSSDKPAQLNLIPALYKRPTLKFHLCYSFDEFDEVIKLIADKKIDVMRHYSCDWKLDDIQAAYEELKKPDSDKVKIMVQFPRGL